MEFICDDCNKKFGTIESLNQHREAKHKSEKKEKKSFKKIFFIVSLILIIFFLSWTVYSYTSRAGKYDEFAKCLTEKGAIIYGNDFCEYTSKQRNFFGKSKKYLNYIKCIDNAELCNKKGIKVTPTWEYKGNFYPQVQTFETLSSLTGCEL